MFFKGLRMVLEEFVFTMHSDLCETGSQIPRAIGLGIWLPVSHKPECIVTAKPDRSVLITVKTWHFQFHLSWLLVFSIQNTNKLVEARGVSRTSPIATSRGACSLKRGIVASQSSSSRDAALMTRYLTLLISARSKPFKNSTTIQHVYNYSASIFEGCNVTFWHQWLLEFPMSCICGLIKAAAMEILMPFLVKIHTVML